MLHIIQEKMFLCLLLIPFPLTLLPPLLSFSERVPFGGCHSVKYQGEKWKTLMWSILWRLIISSHAAILHMLFG